ncbi:hypothetical protein GCM10027161_06720 [Microbispora hainanensis]
MAGFFVADVPLPDMTGYSRIWMAHHTAVRRFRRETHGAGKRMGPGNAWGRETHGAGKRVGPGNAWGRPPGRNRAIPAAPRAAIAACPRRAGYRDLYVRR